MKDEGVLEGDRASHDAPLPRPEKSERSDSSFILHPSSFLQYAAAWLVLKSLGLLPWGAAFAAGKAIGRIAYAVAGGLRRTGYRNLELAMPELDRDARERILRGEFESLGRQLGAFSQLPKIKPREGRIGYRGIEHLDAALAEGKGVLFLTGHMGGWELSCFCLHLDGHPRVNFLVRRIDNPLVERLADRYRTLRGNRSIDKREAARAVLSALRKNELVGILADINVTADEGVFVDFFGHQACMTTGVAVFALRTNAVVVPAYLPWEKEEGRYVLTFFPPVEISRTGVMQDDIRENTQRFAKALEGMIRRHPEQWLWIHKRWKTRPPGEPGLY
jgi:Kdo2-lipid IVA lauroyltransferase/acyltransferase